MRHKIKKPLKKVPWSHPLIQEARYFCKWLQLLRATATT